MTLSRRTFIALTAATAFGGALPLSAREAVALGGLAFGSSFRLTLPGEAVPDAAPAHIAEVVATIDALMSPWRPESELSRFNAHTGLDPLPLSPDTGAVVAAALAIARRSGGAFDPTVGPLVARYGFGPIGTAAPGHFSQLHLEGGGLRKDEARLSLDLCGIAKGHALDLMVAGLDSLGLDSYLLELGGEVFARGAHPSGRAWQVAIENPVAGTDGLAFLLALDGRAVATSGSKANGYEIGGRRYTHIIDPRAQSPVTGNLLSVSVLSDKAMLADGWATALMASGLERGAALAEASGLDALFLVRDGEGIKSVPTGRFAEHLLI